MDRGIDSPEPVVFQPIELAPHIELHQAVNPPADVPHALALATSLAVVVAVVDQLAAH